MALVSRDHVQAGNTCMEEDHYRDDVGFFITKIEGSTNCSAITYLNITYESVSEFHMPYHIQHSCGPFGTPSAKNFSFEGVILGFHGRAGQLLNNIGVYSLVPLNKSKEFGEGSGGDGFDDEMARGFPPLTGISTLYIWHGDHINAIQTESWQQGGFPLLGYKRGGDGGEITAVTLEAGEQIVEFHGEYNDDCISKVHFITQKNGGRKTFYGPFGKPGKTTFAFFGKVFGFHGHAGDMINKIGFYYKATSTLFPQLVEIHINSEAEAAMHPPFYSPLASY